MQIETLNLILLITSYWRNGGLREKFKVSPYFVATTDGADF